MADYLDINVSTVSKAFKACTLKGLLSATVGKGTFVAFDALSSVRLLTEGATAGIIEMGATVPDYKTNALIMEPLREMLNEPNADALLGYNRPDETTWQKDAAVQLMLKCGYETHSENILFANGGQNAIVAVLFGLFGHGDKIGVTPHTYSDMKSAANILGIQLVPIVMNDNKIDIVAFEEACTTHDLKGVYIITDCQNPTTYTMSLVERKKFAEAARKKNILIIEDGTYRLLCPAIPTVSSFAPDRSINIVSLSKAIAPGLRLAYVSVPSAYKDNLSNALIISCTLGSLIGKLLPFDMTGIDFSATAFFAAVVVDQWTKFDSHIPVIIGLISAVLFYLLLGAGNFILPALSVSMVTLIVLRDRVQLNKVGAVNA